MTDRLPSGETPSPSRGPKLSASSSSRNDCDESQWLLIPNNLEINSQSKPSKKQRNKEKLRSFPQENLSMPASVAEGLTNEYSSHIIYLRPTFDTASWLKDQLVESKLHDQKPKKKVHGAEEMFPDSDMAIRCSGLNFPILANDAPEQPEEAQRPSSRRSLTDNENTKSRKDECRKNEADSAIVMERLSQIQDFLTDATTFCQELELSDEPVSEKSGYAVNDISPSSSSKASIAKTNVHRDSNSGSGFCNDEHVNKCKNMIEELQQFAGTPMSSKLQETLLYYMQKKSENKLTSMQGSSNLGPQDTHDLEVKRSAHEAMLSCNEELHNSSSNSTWIVENEEHRWGAKNSAQNPSFDQSEKQLSNWKEDTKDVKQLQTHMKKRVQSIQQIPDMKNVSRSISSDDCDVSNVGEQVAAVEFERKKLKNKLVELQEKKKLNDVMLQKLCYLKDATQTVPPNEPKKEERSPHPSSSRNSQPQVKNKKRADSSLTHADKKLIELQGVLQKLEEGMIKSIFSDEFVQDGASANEASGTSGSRIDNRNIRSGSNVKRDNVKKEMNSGFPARRHYEAEGRANEDADVPNVPISSQPSVSNKWQRRPGKQGRIRNLQDRQIKLEKHVKLIGLETSLEILNSVHEAQNSGTPMPVEHLRLLSFLEREHTQESDKELSSSSSEEECFETLTIENSMENPVTSTKEVFPEASRVSLHQSDSKSSAACDGFVAIKDVTSFAHDSEKCGKSNPSEKFLDVFFKDPNQDSDSNEGSDSDFPIAPDENMVTHPKLPAALHLNENHDHHENPPAVVPCTENERPPTYQGLIQQLMQIYHGTSERRNEDAVRSSGEGDYIPNRNHTCSLPSASEHVQSVSPLQFCRHQENLLLTQQNIATMESQNQGRNLRTKDKSAKKDNINNLSGKMGKLKIQNAVHASFAPMSGGSRDNVDSASMLSSEMNLSHSGEGERKTILDILKRSKKKQKVYDRNHDNQICSNSSIESEPLESSNSALAANTSAATWGGSSTQENFGDENDIASSIIPEGHAVGGSNYHDTPKARKILKLGSLRGATSGSSSEQPISLPPTSTKDYQQHTSSHFIQQLKKQIDQLNALCQRELQSETPQASTNFFPNSNQNWLSACPPPQALPDIVHPYNQQLLLCLSQCYHTLYMQQLEIQHLHRCLRHNADAETLHVNNLSSQSENTEDISLRPWCIPNSNPTMPSNMYSSEHLSSRSAYLPVSGTRPVRAVIHPANQETRVSQETLNNQVPPRTRANNFWDNFRSYSRQNLLSTSNTVKRNDNVSFPVAPQIRQVHPMVSNESIVPEQEMGNSYPSMASDYMSFRSSLNADRSLQNPDGALHNPDRAVQNSDIQDLSHRTKKTNSSSPLLVRSRGSEFHKKGSSSNNFSGDRNTRSARFNSLSNEFSVPNETSINLIQLHSNQEESKVENFSHICPSSTSEAAASFSMPESTAEPEYAEREHQSDFLLGLYSEVKALKSDYQRQEALKIIRSIALREKEGDSDSGQSKIKIDNTSCSKPETSVTVAPPSDQEVNNLSVETCSSTADEVDPEKIPNRLSSESSLPWMNQNLPTAAIPPLSKLAPSKSTSTGAVRKKTKLQSTCFWDSLSNPQACSVVTPDSRTTVGDDYVASPLQPIRENMDFPAGVVDSIIVDLQFALPFGQMREDSSVSFWSSINAYIINRIRAYMPVPLPHKSLASLRQTLDHVLTRFSGMKFCDCEAEFLKYISQLLYESLTCFMSTGRFTSSLPFMPDCDGASVQESEKPQDLCVKLPSETDDKTRELSINMPIDDVFLPPFQPVMQQNVLSTSGMDDNANIDSTQPLSIPTEEDIPHEWGPEAEAEPEVEAGTEADLAEADQSPGQQGNISSTSHGMDTWSADPIANLHSGPLSSDEIAAASDDASEVIGAHCCPDSCGDEEVNLDNVPTKLCAEEEPQRLGEVVQLPSDDPQENNETSIENSENEVTSTK